MRFIAFLAIALAMSGCRSTSRNAAPTSSPTTQVAATRPFTLDADSSTPGARWDLAHAVATPPPGWTYELKSQDKSSAHILWLSPSTDTAFGIIFFRMPFPVGHELALKYGVIPNVRKNDGRADVSEQTWDDHAEAMRITIDSNTYKTRALTAVRGKSGWFIYAGTVQNKPVNEAELQQAIEAREATRIIR